jgi:outer membrane protease
LTAETAKAYSHYDNNLDFPALGTARKRFNKKGCMKSITIFSVFVCLILCPPLGAETPVFPYTLSLSPQFGVFYGQGEERVYQNEDSDSLKSQLLWDLKPLCYGGIKLEFAQRNPLDRFGVFGALSVKFGIPMGTGAMEDRDWLAPGGALSHYSRHDASGKGALILDLTTGPSIPAGPFLAFRPTLGFSYSRFSWTSKNGYRRYNSGFAGGNDVALKDSDPVVPESGTMVSYFQDWLYMPMGLSVLVTPDRRFSGGVWFYAGPVLKFLGFDEHHRRLTQFRDEVRGGYFLEPGGEFRFNPGKRLSLRIYGSWRYFAAKPHGESHSKTSGGKKWNFLGNTSGGALQTMDLGIGLEVRL